MMIQNSFGVPLGRDATLKVLIRAAFQRFIALVKRMSASRGDDGAIRNRCCANGRTKKFNETRAI
jgi:hypothetical protein